MLTSDILNSHPVLTLKKEISKTNIKGYSKMKKIEIVKLMLNNKERFNHIVKKGEPPKPKKIIKIIKDKKPKIPTIKITEAEEEKGGGAADPIAKQFKIPKPTAKIRIVPKKPNEDKGKAKAKKEEIERDLIINFIKKNDNVNLSYKKLNPLFRDLLDILYSESDYSGRFRENIDYKYGKTSGKEGGVKAKWGDRTDSGVMDIKQNKINYKKYLIKSLLQEAEDERLHMDDIYESGYDEEYLKKGEKEKPKIPTITITEADKPKRKVIKIGGRFITPKEVKSKLPPIPKFSGKFILPKAEKSKGKSKGKAKAKDTEELQDLSKFKKKSGDKGTTDSLISAIEKRQKEDIAKMDELKKSRAKETERLIKALEAQKAAEDDEPKINIKKISAQAKVKSLKQQIKEFKEEGKPTKRLEKQLKEKERQLSRMK